MTFAPSVLVERSFGIIGEAPNQLGRISPPLAARIPDRRQAVDFRNLLAHGYDLVDPQILWDTAVNDIPGLRQAVRSLLAELH